MEYTSFLAGRTAVSRLGFDKCDAFSFDNAFAVRSFGFSLSVCGGSGGVVYLLS